MYKIAIVHMHLHNKQQQQQNMCSGKNVQKCLWTDNTQTCKSTNMPGQLY